jgi:death-on-curing family protein
LYSADEIIDANRAIIKSRGEEQSDEIDMEILESLVYNINHRYNTIADHEERMLKQATHLIWGLCFRQPFFDGNKSTALALGIDFLVENGYDLPLETTEQNEEMYDMLNGLMYATKEYEDLEKFLKERMVSRSS